MPNKIVGVVMGGRDFESHISLLTGQNVLKLINSIKGYRAIPIYYSSAIDLDIRKIKPDIIFNAMHGQYGEDGSLSAYLDMIQIPYTHSGFTASSIGMNKTLAKALVSSININIAKYVSLTIDTDHKKQFLKINNIKIPYVIKPIATGTSIGIKYVNNANFDLEQDYSWDLFPHVLIEEFIPGAEFTVLILADKPVGALEISKEQSIIFGYENKVNYDPAHYILPTRSIVPDSNQYRELLDLALQVHKHIGCKDISRVDFILNSDCNKFYFLEINTHPGLIDSLSLSIKIANAAGITTLDLIKQLLENAAYKDMGILKKYIHAMNSQN